MQADRLLKSPVKIIPDAHALLTLEALIPGVVLQMKPGLVFAAEVRNYIARLAKRDTHSRESAELLHAYFRSGEIEKGTVLPTLEPSPTAELARRSIERENPQSGKNYFLEGKVVALAAEFGSVVASAESAVRNVAEKDFELKAVSAKDLVKILAITTDDYATAASYYNVLLESEGVAPVEVASFRRICGRLNRKWQNNLPRLGESGQRLVSLREIKSPEAMARREQLVERYSSVSSNWVPGAQVLASARVVTQMPETPPNEMDGVVEQSRLAATPSVEDLAIIKTGSKCLQLYGRLLAATSPQAHASLTQVQAYRTQAFDLELQAVKAIRTGRFEDALHAYQGGVALGAYADHVVDGLDSHSGSALKLVTTAAEFGRLEAELETLLASATDADGASVKERNNRFSRELSRVSEVAESHQLIGEASELKQLSLYYASL